MNELERAAHDLVTNPAVEPTPLATLEAGAARRRHRAVGGRAVSAAALVLLVVVAGVVLSRSRSTDVDVRLGAEGGATRTVALRVTWDGQPGQPSKSTALSLTELSTSLPVLVKDRLLAYGATDVEVAVEPGARSLSVHATGVALDDARLLLETPGRFEGAIVARLPVPNAATGTTDCTAQATSRIESVGWPVAKPLDACVEVRQTTVDLSARGAGEPSTAIAAVAAKADGKLWTIDVSWRDGQVPAGFFLGSCVPAHLSSCDADAVVSGEVMLDGALVRASDVDGNVPPGEKAPVESTPTGFVVRGFTERDARALAAILSSGSPPPVRLHVSVLDETTTPTVAGTTEPCCPSVPVTTASSTPTGTEPGTGTPLTLVYVAKAPIPRGASGSDAVRLGYIVRSEVPMRFRPSTAIQSTDVLTSKAALFAIGEGTVIVAGMFVDANGSEPTPLDPLTTPGSVMTTRPDLAGGMVEVLVVTGSLKRGASFDDALQREDIRLVSVPASSRPAAASAVTDESALAHKVALYDMEPGTIIVGGMFVDP